MDNFLNLLNKELSPYLKPEKFELIQEKHKTYFNEVYLKHYNCSECNKFCTLEYENIDDKLVSYCPEGYFEDEIIICKDELKRHRFKIDEFIKTIAEVNSIYFYKNQINKDIILFGEKELNGINYKLVYIINAFQENKLKEEFIYKIKEWLNPEERALIITPAFIITNKQFISYLQQNRIEILFLKGLLLNDLRIFGFIKSDSKNIENLINDYDFVIIDESQVYLYKKSLKLSNMAFRLLYFIALKGKEGFSASYQECIEYIWQDCINKDIDYMKQLPNHRSAINEACKKAGLEEKIYKNFIKPENKSYKLMIEPEKTFIA